MSENCKKCRSCGIPKPRTSEYFPPDSRNKDKLQGKCRVCARGAMEDWRKRNPDAWKEHHYSQYGLTAAQVEEMKKGGCHICGRHVRLAIDHDHDTGAVRGVLCHACNTGIGKLGDSIEGLERALEYLKRHEHITD